MKLVEKGHCRIDAAFMPWIAWRMMLSVNFFQKKNLKKCFFI